MKNQEITKLRKQYPADKFNVRESQGSVIVTPRKSVIRVFRYQAERLDESGDATKYIEELLKKTKLSKTDFEQRQTTITTELNKELLKRAADCKTRRIIFLQRLLGAE